jgi:GAF domain-containing protein
LPNPKGVCWQTVINKKPIIVGDVNAFKDHITCDARSKSEIALPVFNNQGELFAVLDVDSDRKQAFDIQDEMGLTKILSLLQL